MDRVVVTSPFVNIFTMQVCAVADATDEEILVACNRDNPAGTTNGWAVVVREPELSLTQPAQTAPVACADHPGRTHFLVQC